MNIKATIIEHQQGSEAWVQHRSRSLNASELAAVMGDSSYTSRAELIKQKAAGIVPEVDAATQRRFDKGHEYEAAARAFAEEIIGESLYPCVLAAEVDGLYLSASLDGQDLLGDVTWEHKSGRADLLASLERGVIPTEYHPQLEQGLMLSGATRCLFMASNGTRESMRSVWYESTPALRAKIIPAWKQFMADVAAYVPTEKAAPVLAAPVETLPAVSVKVDGALAIVSNLPAFGEALRKFIGKIPEQPSTDQEFADTDAACKALKRAEDALEAAEANALAQLSDVDTMRRFVADFKALARTTRLQREKLVAQRKESIKGELVAAGVAAMAKHIRELNASMPADYMPQVPADFGGCIKGLRTVDSIRNAVDTELARVKIMANEIANRVHANVKTLKDSGLVVHDAAALVLKQPDDLAAVIAQRVAAEKAKEEAQRERIRAEEAARLEREAKAEQREKERQAEIAAAALLVRQQADAAKVINPILAAAVIEQPFFDVAADAANTGIGIISRSSESVTRIDPAAVIEDGRRLTLGQLNFLLAPVSISATGMAELGFEPVERVKNSCLYRRCDVPRICAAITEHLRELASEMAAA